MQKTTYLEKKYYSYEPLGAVGTKIHIDSSVISPKNKKESQIRFQANSEPVSNFSEKKDDPMLAT